MAIAHTRSPSKREELSPATHGRHRREHRSVLAEAERRLLIGIAERLPLQVGPDHLTALGLASMMAAGLAFAATPLDARAPLLVVPFLFLNWFGDSLDGTLARVRRQERPRYGFYVDHVVDVVAAASLMGGLAASGLMAPVLALVLLSAWIAVMAESFLATHAGGVFRLSFGGFGPTELRILIAAGATQVAVASPNVTLPGLGDLRLFDAGATVALAFLIVAFVVSAWRTAAVLRRAETRRQ